MQKISQKKFTKNVLISIFVQVPSLLISFLLNLVVPKFIDEYQYTYWQTYILYVGYVGVLHFGLLDGLMLRYSKYDYDELDKPRIRSQFLLLLSFTGILTLVISTVSVMAIHGTSKLIIILVAVGIISKNLVTYSLYTFQITNRVSKYATLIVLQKLIYGTTVISLLLLFRINNFVWFCIADLGADFLSVLIMSKSNHGLYFGSTIPTKNALKELKCNIGAGIFLMLANWSSMLLLGGAKLFAQWHWDELLFGKVSFAFSVLNLFLIFVTTISVVLFPALKRLDEESLPKLYKQIRDVVTLILLFVIALYFPGCWFLSKWLPNYTASLTYLGIVLPIVIYSAKVSLLTNNFLKVYRKERLMLLVNAISVGIGIICFAISTFVFNNIIALLLSMVFVIILNSTISEIAVMKHIHIRFVKEFIMEAIMAIAFILIAYFIENIWLGLVAYLGMTIIYCILNPKVVLFFIHSIRKRGSHTPPNDEKSN